ncbi:hypothetical protein E2542_SST12553 [Spatholobus suberectus]|nr:hypothetical protein E2542_SST12553 [Spatholobus suberectus]
MNINISLLWCKMSLYKAFLNWPYRHHYTTRQQDEKKRPKQCHKSSSLQLHPSLGKILYENCHDVRNPIMDQKDVVKTEKFQGKPPRSQRPKETSLPQDTQPRILPPKESCSLVPRRKERGDSLRDASLLCVAAGFVKSAAEL